MYSITKEDAKKKNKFYMLPGGMLWAVLFVCFLGITGCGLPQSVQTKEVTGIAMGTMTSQKIYQTDSVDHTQKIQELVDELEKTKLSRRISGSEVDSLNTCMKEGKKLTFSDEMKEWMELGEQLWEDSDRVFDLTLGELVCLWNIDELVGEDNPDIPTDDRIQDAKIKCGFHNLNAKEGTYDEAVMLDLGAVGKGIALDCIHEYLQGQEQVSGAIISMGGSILTYGEKPDYTDFKVAIVDPFETSTYIGYLELDGTNFVSTSGGYERFIEINNMRYHHILDPITGYPAKSDVASVTIVADSGYLSDALSTACFILGKEKGMKLAKKYHAEVLFVMESGEVVLSSGLENCFVRK